MNHLNLYQRYFKTALDWLLALLLFTILLPLLILIALSILVSARESPIFIQQRVGKNQKLFEIYKFRTLYKRSNSQDSKTNDQEITPLGSFLRSTSLDELPQLINILKGEMSFVGPRPLIKDYLSLYTDRQAQRHRVKPGITGLAQIKGRNAISWSEKFELDLEYIRELSLVLDFMILLKTFKAPFVHKNINDEGRIGGTPFDGFN